MTPKAKKKDDSDSDDYVGSESPQSDIDSDESKPRTRGRLQIVGPPVTPSPKKPPARVNKRSIEEEDDTSSPMKESPKKQRIDKYNSTKNTASPSKLAKIPQAKPLLPKKTEKNMDKESHNTDDNSSDDENASSIDSVNKSVEDLEGKPNRSLEDSKGKQTKVLVYPEDLEPAIKLPVLDKCGVFNKESVDKLLKHTYSKLPKLPGGKRLIGWRNLSQQSTEEGFAFFSSVKETFPDADMGYLRGLLCFEADKPMNVANLSRADPSLFCLKTSIGLGLSPYICYRGSTSPVHCLIMGLVHEDRTRSAYPLSTGKWMKSLSLIPFAMEADRMIASTAVIYETDSFHGQVVDGNILSFATRQGLMDSSARGSPSSSKTKRGRFAKPTSAVGSSSQSTATSVRGPEDDIPILDARQHKLKLPDNAKNLVNTFPRFSGTIPRDSVVLACYTASKYEKIGSVYASFNILWAAVICGNDS